MAAATVPLRTTRTISIAVLVIAAALLKSSPVALAQSLRINSPRGVGGETDSGGGGSEEGPDSGDVLIKLPTDLKAVLDLQKADRRRIHASILGLHPDGGDEQSNLHDILGDVSSPPPATTSSSSPPPPYPSTTRDTLHVTPNIDGDRRRQRQQQQQQQQRKNRRQRKKTAEGRLLPETTTTAKTTSVAEPDTVPAVKERSIGSLVWEAHVYFSGTLFVLLAIYCSVNILRLHTFSRLFSRGYFVGLNLCIIVVGVLRPVYLFVDPYNASGSLPRIVAYLLLDTGYPAITTGFAILFLALLRATQIELVSPSFQTPRSLAVFCLAHLAISMAVDIAVGLAPSVRYLVLICQGFFIVWSLLLSAGYFYIFSSMKKVSLRTGTDGLRSYPKLVLDGASNGFVHTGDATGRNGTIGGGKPPLCRAVHLALGVAVLGSLMGGVQLFGMIKMLGLQKADMSSHQNEWAWYGYQLSMRVLELALCTLLAVIATTPLRSDPPQGQYDVHGNPLMPPRRRSSRCLTSCLNCCKDSPPMIEFEDEIYSEICGNHHTIRQMQSDPSNPYGTLGGIGGIHPAAGSGVVIPMGTLSAHHYHPGHGPPSSTTSNQNLLLFNSSMLNNAAAGAAHGSHHFVRGSDSASNPNSTLRAAVGGRASSRATMESAIYSNVAGAPAAGAGGAVDGGGGSRPSSMLYNEAGFVRFRMGGDPGRMVDEVLRQSSDDLVRGEQETRLPSAVEPLVSRRGMGLEGLRASQSFDESVLLMDGRPSGVPNDRLSPSSPRGPRSKHSSSGSKNRTRQSPIYKSIDSLKSEEELYEAPPGMPPPPLPPAGPAVTAQVKDSESEYEPAYAAGGGGGGGGARSVQQIYNSSRCSSISATQSFDMRMYGIMPPQNVHPNPGAAAGPGAFASATLKRNEEAAVKLENPYYYYGSTRNQKKQGKMKPRPLLPSQRAQLELAKKGMMGRPQSRQETTTEQQPVTTASAADSVIPPAFQRSRSLGGYYNQGRAQQQQPLPPPAPARNQQVPRHPLIRQPLAAAGSMTPLSYSRWQHALQQEAGAQRGYNALYHDTPPTQRAAHIRMAATSASAAAAAAYEDHAARRQLNHQHPSFFMPEIRRLAPQTVDFNQPRPPPQPQPRSHHHHHHHHQQLLSPILTDAESGGSPMRRNLIAEDDDYGDESEADDQFTSQATQGYSQGLADNETEASSDRGTQLNKGKDLHLVSPLEYSAMLKLYGGGGADATDFQRPVSSKKDVTPDSGVVNSDSNKSRKSQQHAPPAAELVLGKKNKPMYSKINTEDDEGDEYSARGNTTVFSSSSSSDDSEVEPSGAKQVKGRYQPYQPVALAGSPVPEVENRPAATAAAASGYRWNGSRMPAVASAGRQTSSDVTSGDDVDGDVADDEENDGDVSDDETTTANIPATGRQVVEFCKEIQSSEFGSP